MWAKLMDAMRELGYAEGQNLIVRLALADGNPERLPALVAEYAAPLRIESTYKP